MTNGFGWCILRWGRGICTLAVICSFLFFSPIAEAGLQFYERFRDSIGLDNVQGIAASPDGKFIYAVAGGLEGDDHSITVLGRDTLYGNLTFLSSIGYDPLVGESPHLKHAKSVLVSPDGGHVYILTEGHSELGVPTSLSVYSRDNVTGLLTFESAFDSGTEVGLLDARDFAISADSKTVYVVGGMGGSGSVAAWSRNSSTGALTFINKYTELNSPSSVGVSPDGNHVYVTDDSLDSVAIYTRDSGTGALNLASSIVNGTGGVTAMDGPMDIAIKADGTRVFILSKIGNSLTHFTRNSSTGVLTHFETLQEGVNGIGGLNSPNRLAISSVTDDLFVVSEASIGGTFAVYQLGSIVPSLIFFTIAYADDGGEGIDSPLDVIATSNDVYVAGAQGDKVVQFSGTFSYTRNSATSGNENGLNGLDRGDSTGFSSSPAKMAVYDGDIGSGGIWSIYALGPGENSIAQFNRSSILGTTTYLRKYRNNEDIYSFMGPTDVLVSRDGYNVYITASSNGTDRIHNFGRDLATGELASYGYDEDSPAVTSDTMTTPVALDMSPDDLYVYVAAQGSNAITVFFRSVDGGDLIYYGASVDNNDTVDGIEGISDVAVSQDGVYVYGVSPIENAIAIFMRDSGSGLLIYLGKLTNLPGLTEVNSVTVHPGNQFVYTTSAVDNSIGIFKRNDVLPNLSYVASYDLRGGTAPVGLAIASSGTEAYLLPGESSLESVIPLTVDTVTGLLGAQRGPQYLSGFTDVAVAPTNSDHVYVVGDETDSMVDFLVDLTIPGVYIDQASGQADPTDVLPIQFNIGFSEPVQGFVDSDISFGGTATVSGWSITPIDGGLYSLDITAATQGTIIPTIPASVATDYALNPNTASTSDDNSVTYDIIGPTVTLNPESQNVFVGSFVSFSCAATGSAPLLYDWQFKTADSSFVSLGVNADTLSISSAALTDTGEYKCVISNADSEVSTAIALLKVVDPALNQVTVTTLTDTADGDTTSMAHLVVDPGSDGFISLREAILAANATNGANDIFFSVSGAILLDSGLPGLVDSSGGTHIAGVGEIIVDGQNLVSAEDGFQISSANNWIDSLVIINFPNAGIVMSSAQATGNKVTGCWIGTDGTTAMPNAHGVMVDNGANGNMIGGTNAGEENVISGNSGFGVWIDGAGTSNNTIEGNIIGLNPPATSVVGNSVSGVYVSNSASGTQIGSSVASGRNIISGNGEKNIGLSTGASGTRIEGNIIGLEGDGTTVATDVGTGIHIDGSGSNIIGGTEVGSGNVIGGFLTGVGIDITATEGSDFNQILGNVIGTDVTGTQLASNYQGIVASGGNDLLIGDGTPTGANHISGHDGNGIQLTGIARPRVLGNYIGASGNGIEGKGNAGNGIYVGSGVVDALIGNIPEGGGLSNSIANNLGDGVFLTGVDTLRITIQNNSIFNNFGKAITLDSGANEGILPPTLNPVIMSPSTIISGSSLANATIDLYVDAEDEGEIPVDSVFSDGTGNFESTVDLGTYSGKYVTATVTNGQGSTSELSVRQIIDTTPPEVTLLGANPDVYECATGDYADPGATAIDDIDGTLSVTIESGLNLATPGSYTIKYTATDSAGNASSVTRTVNNVDTTAPSIVLNGAETMLVECGGTFTDPGITATDSCEGDVSSLTGVNSNVDTSTPGSYQVVYTATDNKGNTASPVTRTVQVQDMTPPIIVLNGVTDVAVECGAVYTELGAVVTDICEGDISSNHVITGSVDATTPGQYVLEYNAADSAENNALTVQRTVTVVDTTAPSLTLIGAAQIAIECGDAYSELGATASDTCEGDLTSNIQISGTVNNSTPGEYTITYAVSDSAGNESSKNRTVTVADTTAPTVTLLGIGSMTLECGDTYTEAGATATDTCDGDINSGITITGSVDSHTPGVYSLVYRVKDANGLEGSATRTVTVKDTRSPIISLNGIETVQLRVGDSYSDAGASASDHCEGDLTSKIQVVNPVDTTSAGEYTVQYTVVDKAGHSVSTTRTVIVSTNDSPILTLLGQNTEVVECGSDFNDPGATATDTEDGDLSGQIQVSGTVDTSTPGEYALMYAVTDSDSNPATSLTRNVFVQDTTAPVLTLLGATTIQLACGETYNDAGATAFDTCEGELSVTLDISGLDITTSGEYTVTLSSEDSAGNSSSSTRTIFVGECNDTLAACLQACDENTEAQDGDGDGLTDCVEACYGTSDLTTDTDEDGIADNFEIRFGLDPLQDDANLDPDEDDFTNLEEFLRNSNPKDPSVPSHTYFVGPDGRDSPERGGKSLPWRTITYALSQIQSSQETPSRLNLFTGVYQENVVMQPYLILASAIDHVATITGTIIGAQEAGLEALAITGVEDESVLLTMTDVRMRVAGCVFQGTEARQSTGIMTSGTTPRNSVIEQCGFSELAVAIDISGGIPIIRRCVFENLSGSGVLIRAASTAKEENNTLGQEDDPTSGWNNFDTPTIDGFAVVNGTGQELVMENNEWGTEDEEEIRAKISGEADFVPYLGVGNAILAASVFCTIWDAETQVVIENATVTLRPSSYRDVTENVNGVYAFPVVAEGSYTIRCSAPTYKAVSRSVRVSGGDLESLTIPLSKDDGTGGEDKNPPACHADGNGSASGGPGDGMLILFMILVLLLPMLRSNPKESYFRQH